MHLQKIEVTIMANNENLGSKKSEQLQENENFVTKVLSFFNKYQNIIYGVIIGILVIVLAIMAFNRFYVQKKNAEAAAQIVQPIQWLTKGDTASLKMALECRFDLPQTGSERGSSGLFDEIQKERRRSLVCLSGYYW